MPYMVMKQAEGIFAIIDPDSGGTVASGLDEGQVIDWLAENDRELQPIRVLNPRWDLKAGYVDGTEPTVAAHASHRDVKPCHVAGDFAVYEMYPGEFSVQRHGEAALRPFKTSDEDLAKLVCDEWAVEFPAPRSYSSLRDLAWQSRW